LDSWNQWEGDFAWDFRWHLVFFVQLTVWGVLNRNKRAYFSKWGIPDDDLPTGWVEFLHRKIDGPKDEPNQNRWTILFKHEAIKD
jgi:hypothetical protein